MKILLDTDIGTDVDDAVALAYLLSHPDCRLLGITTVTGEAEKRAALASVLCKQAGIPVPVLPGCSVPMTGSQKQTICQQAEALPRWPHESDFPQGEAIEFLAKTIFDHPDEVTLVTIGPLTNAGMLFSKYPRAAGLLNGLVIMGGIFTEDFPEKERIEWNLAGDALASEIVYAAPVRLHRSLGLDVTQQVVMPAEEVRRRFTAPLLRPVLDFAEIWFSQFYPSITFHDPLTAASVFEPDLCRYERGRVTIDRKDRPGMPHFRPGDQDVLHQVAIEVDAGRYFDHFFQIMG